MNQNKFQFILLRDVPHEFIITMGEGVKDSDLELFFSFNPQRDIIEGISCVKYLHFDNAITWEDLASILELMPSKGQARKNGYNGTIPIGYTEVKKKFHKFYILNLDKSFNTYEVE
jgi:hypothetical protein